MIEKDAIVQKKGPRRMSTTKEEARVLLKSQQSKIIHILNRIAKCNKAGTVNERDWKNFDKHQYQLSKNKATKAYQIT